MSDGSQAATVDDRRIERNRREIELRLDSIFRPGDWAAKISRSLGLQGHIEPTTIELALRHPSTANRPALRIAFASDFHAGATTDDQLLADACRQLAEFHPHVLLLGGDFVSVRASYIDRLAPLLAAIPAPLGKFGVLGNHDLRANHRMVVSELQRAGVRMITNLAVRLPGAFDDITICGLDDPTRGDPQAGRALDGADGTRVVLMHSPEGLDALGDRRFELALCGHTHGGQVALPGGRPMFVPGGRLNRAYPAGHYELDPGGARHLVVSRGVGCSTIPVRLFAGPQVHLCVIAARPDTSHAPA